jgi:hypothetical protein
MARAYGILPPMSGLGVAVTAILWFLYSWKDLFCALVLTRLLNGRALFVIPMSGSLDAFLIPIHVRKAIVPQCSCLGNVKPAPIPHDDDHLTPAPGQCCRGTRG